MGFWKDGKQHGLAEYQTIKQSATGYAAEEPHSRYGQWQNGRRLKWFKIDAAKEIKS